MALRLTRWLGALLVLAAAVPANAQEMQAGRFDNGKMWTFDVPPIGYFQEAYGMQVDESWFESARLSALRIPGCSASFASPNGLVVTNHHCARNAVSGVVQEGENLLDDGFYAPTLEEERRIPGYYADQLVGIEDVTGEVYASLDGQETTAERAAARQETIQAITARLEEQAGDGHVVQVIGLYNGGQYSAYTFRRYDDVRLVMTPELQLGFFGGDSDNFTYPRYALDFTLYRVYDNGEPLATDQYFAWNPEGVQEGDPVFVIGNPGSTFRLETVAQLEYRRDVLDLYVLNLVNSRVGALKAYLEANPVEGEARNTRNQIFGLANAQKLYTGRVKALNDPVVMARRGDFEADFATAVATNEALQAEYGGLLEEMADVQDEKMEYAGAFGAFLSLAPQSALSSAAERRAVLATTYLSRRADGADDQELASILGTITNIQDLPEDLEWRLLAARVQDFNQYLGAEHPVSMAASGGMSPDEAAQSLLAASIFDDGAALAEALESGTLNDDPVLAIAESFAPVRQEYQSAMAGLGGREQELASALGRGRFDVYGTTIPPDATFSLRIADGVVARYAYNGTVAPANTTFYGLYDRYYSHGPDGEWDLPERWLDPPAEFDMSTPVNFASTSDTIGGNSGSPVVDANLNLVGLLFDGNIESLSGDFIYLTESSRSICVDVRGVLEALEHIYGADRIVTELMTGTLVPAAN